MCYEKMSLCWKLIKILSEFHSHLLSFVCSSSSSCGDEAPASGSSERFSKLIMNNEISSASERMGAVWGFYMKNLCEDKK